MRLPAMPVFNFRQDTGSVNINTSYTAVSAALPSETTLANIYNGTTSSLAVAIGATGSQVIILYVPPSIDLSVPFHTSKNTELWVKANSTTASSGEVIINLFY